ncbi:hypothetical protein BGZ47_002256 [Haplosporangium gracile]|nr:hypothetical protein BGZ47_002256 [Haplosporangium gracile]
MQQQQKSFIPPFVRDLVYFDKTQHQPSPSSDDPDAQPSSISPVEYISNDGLIILDAMQTCLPVAVVQSHIPTASQPEDFNPFRRCCVAVLDKLTRLTLKQNQTQGDGDGISEVTKALLDLYNMDRLEPWLGETGRRATEVWFEAFVRGEYDQAWLVGSTVLEQLIVNIRVMKTLMGSPLTLNIRNLLWHGFITPEDQIPLDAYGAMLIVTTMSIAMGVRQKLTTGLQIRHGGVPRANFYFQQGGRGNLWEEQGEVLVCEELGEFDAIYGRVAYGDGRLPLLMSSSSSEKEEGRCAGQDQNQDRVRLVLEAIVCKSSFVTIGTVEQWISALRHLKSSQSISSTESTLNITTTTTVTSTLTTTRQRSSFMFVVASLPLLEHGLRLMYVHANGCKQDRTSALVAGEYYLTLDVILDEFVPAEYYESDAEALKEYRPDAIPNRLYSELGSQAMNLLQDLFLAAMGPRLRDRTSHGENNAYFRTDIRKEPWFDYYLGIVVSLLTLDMTTVPGEYGSMAEETRKWVRMYTERRFDEWSAIKKETVRALCMLLEYHAVVLQDASGKEGDVEDDVIDEGASSGVGTAKGVEESGWITLRLKPKMSVVFSGEESFDTDDVNLLTAQDRIRRCLSAWPTRTINTQNTSPNSNPNNNNSNEDGGIRGMASNLPAWMLIVQSIQVSTEKVTTKMRTFLKLQRQRQLSSRSRRQLETMRPLVPGWLGMLAGCLALVEHFVILPEEDVDMKVGVWSDRKKEGSQGNNTPDKVDISDNRNNSMKNGKKGEEEKAAGVIVDKSSAVEIRLRLAIVNFLNKFVSNFERVKLPTIEAAWLDFVEAVEPILSKKQTVVI